MSTHFFGRKLSLLFIRLYGRLLTIANVFLWRAIHYRPMRSNTHWAAMPNDIREEVMRQATIETAQFVRKEMPSIEPLLTPRDLLTYALNRVTLDGLYLEFGVFSGSTISYIASIKTKVCIHGFDSFQGLPESWENAPKGQFSTEGRLPSVPANVKLHVGLFDQTLPGFIAAYPDTPVAFLHADADLYSSTKTIFAFLGERIVPGTILLFDEYFNYPGWQNHEHKAFIELVASQGLSFEYLSYAARGYSVAVKITGKSRVTGISSPSRAV